MSKQATIDTTILDCGHVPSAHGASTTGYGVDAAGKTLCYTCCADGDRASMRETGRATLYLTRDAAGAWQVSNWPGSLSIPARGVIYRPHAGGFGAQRTDAWFAFEGFVWHAVNRGDMDIARCRRTKARVGATERG